jgi:hypothetical protein
MGLVEGILIAAAALVLVGAIVSWMRHPTVAPPDPRDELLTAAHETIDEIELARVRSMLQRR